MNYTEPEYDIQEMDHRHVAMIETFLLSRKTSGVLEIGCWKGRCTAAILNAYKAGQIMTVDLCDVDIKPEIRRMVATHTDVALQQMTGGEILRGREAYIYQTVILDNGHSLDVSREEWNEMARLRPQVLIPHDVTATAAGYENCEGPGWMLEEIRHAGYQVVIDNEKRPNERTHRGLAFCCLPLEAFAAAQSAIQSHL